MKYENEEHEKVLMVKRKQRMELIGFYYQLGFSLIPIRADKTPLIEWKKYQNEKADKHTVYNWFFERYPNCNIGIVTGRVSKIVVVDADYDEESEQKLKLPSTATSQTGRGYHYFFKYPVQDIKTSIGFKEFKKVDIKSDGGYVIAPNSIHESGKEYKWLRHPSDCPFAELPDYFFKDHKISKNDDYDIKNNESNNGKWTEILNENILEGRRNDRAIKIAGKLYNPEASKDREFILGVLSLWNGAKCTPSLPEKELKNVLKSAEKMSEADDIQHTNTIQQFLNFIKEEYSAIFFHDTFNEPFICLNISEHQEIKNIKSENFKIWLKKLYYTKQKKFCNDITLKNITDFMSAESLYEGREYELHNRVAWQDGNVWYDLTDSEWRAVKITTDGWSITNKLPIIFKREKHQKPQIEPNENNGDVKRIFKYINISNSEQQFLFLIYLISLFIPGLPHCILVFYGPQGSAKSTAMRITKRLVDPSSINVCGLPRDVNELIQRLSHHWCLFFDNISSLPDWVSDLLCKTVTGESFSKRQLYTDDEDIICSIKLCIGLNGINLVVDKPDLLERCLLFELDRITDDKRKTEEEIIKEFEKDQPILLGGVFNTISKAMKIKPTLKNVKKKRMADFVEWGSAIAIALGYKQEDFLRAYSNNIKRQHEEVISDSTMALLIVELMKNSLKYEKSASGLLEELKIIAGQKGIDIKGDSTFPKTASALSKKINELKTNLFHLGLEINRQRSNTGRIIEIKKVDTNAVISDIPSQNEIHKEKNNDDANKQNISSVIKSFKI